MYQELEARIKELEVEVETWKDIDKSKSAILRNASARIRELEAEAEGTQAYVEFLKATLIQDTVPEAYLTRLERAERVVEAVRAYINGASEDVLYNALADYDKEGEA